MSIRPELAAGLPDWLSYIEQLHPVGWDLGLDRVLTVGKRLGVLHPAPITILVAGTNGKGSTCEFLYRFAESSGLTTGLSTSPHLHVFNERIRINGCDASDEDICDAFRHIDDVRGDVTLTYFEFASLASMLLFQRHQVDVAILEVGLGGRLDAMNIVNPDISVITAIDLDHQDWLGHTRDEIAVEKAGVMRPGIVTVVSDRHPPDTMIRYAQNLDAPLDLLGETFELPTAIDQPELPADSFCAALRIAQRLSWNTADAGRIARETRLPGRRTWRQDKCQVLMDVAHNPAAAQSLADYLNEQPGTGRIHALTGMYRDKDIEAVTRLLASKINTWHLTEMDDPRAASCEEFLRRLTIDEHGNVSTYDKIEVAFEAVRQIAGENDLILVFGSFPVVAGVLSLLKH